MTGFVSKRQAAQAKLDDDDNAQPEQEPVAWMSSDRAWMWSDYSKALAAVVHIPRLTLIPLHTTPRHRQWVGLTEWEREAIAHACGAMGAEWLVFIEAVEKALKEKNR